MSPRPKLRRLPPGLLLLCLFFFLPPLAQPGQYPVDHIAVSFDLEKCELYGILLAEVPQEVTSFSLGRGIRISRVAIDDEIYDASIQDGRLPLPPRQRPVRVRFEYEMAADRKGFQMVSWRDIQEIFSEVSKQDLREFFRFWLETGGMIDLEMDGMKVWPSGDGHTFQLRLRVQNAPLPVALVFKERNERKPLVLRDTQQTIQLKMGERPLRIIIDPDYDLFRTLSEAEQRPLLSRLLGDPARTVVLPTERKEIYGPLTKALEKRGFAVMEPKDFSHRELTKGSVLFLAPQREFGSLFPSEERAKTGFSLRIRRNPFDQTGVLGLAWAEDPVEVSLVTPRLFHYGAYSMVRFEKGKSVKKVSPKGKRRMEFEVSPPVTGIVAKSLLPLGKIIFEAAQKRVVFVGERHDRYGDHLVQLEVIRGIHKIHPKLAIGMEMFERRYQEALDHYVSGLIDEETFLRRSRYFRSWKYNYYLYRDILQYARSEKIPVIALNQDNELVSRVAEVGLERLGEEERARIPDELSFEDASYEKRLLEAFKMHQAELPGGRAPKVFEYFHQAQIVWDETMAETIEGFLSKRVDHRMVVLAGNGHLEYGSGIPKRVKRRLGIDYAIILPDPGNPLEAGIADFIVFPAKAKEPESPKLGVMLDFAEGALLVKGFTRGSHAREAGMEEGDRILALDNRQVKDIPDLKASLALRRIGEAVTVTVIRKEVTLDIKVRLVK